MVTFLFGAVLLAVVVFFVFVRQSYDLYSLAALSSCVYFIPGVWGVDLRGIPLQGEVYVIMIGVLLALICFALVLDRVRETVPSRTRLASAGSVLFIYGVLALGVFVFILYHYGPATFFGHQGGTALPGWVFIAWRVPASLFLVLAVVRRSKAVWIASALAIAMYLSGDRTGPVLATLAVIFAVLTQVDKRVALKRVLRYSPFLLLFAVLALFADVIFSGIKLIGGGATIQSAFYMVGSRLDWRLAIRTSEPFVTQMVLNEIVRKSFYVGPQHLIGIFYQLWPIPSAFGYKSGIFNDMFQTALFPESRSATANWGMAHSFWGEGLASGGWAMLALFLATYLAGLALFNRMLKSPHPVMKTSGALMGAYWAFYIHRNSIANIITFERHICYVVLLASAGAIVLTSVRRRRKPIAPLHSY